ncbi:MAG: NADP-dependent oxidoreductase, partial [Alphaproteobacteria bacterium]|nr:NADP-dependent oxidoreductase [Alphaproteobacteria bacterium]
MGSGITATQWVVDSRPNDKVREENFSRQQVELPDLGEGEFLVQTVYLTVSPPLRMWLTSGGLSGVPVELGEVMRGAGLGRVVKSHNANFEEGTLVRGGLGWTDFVISDGKAKMPVTRVEPPKALPLSTCMHVLGASGPTAYFGLYDIGQPRIGDVILVSAAAGSVGSIVCQLAKMSGCTVIGIAGSDKKCEWLTKELGADAAINYRKENVAEAIPRLCPKGVDIYFDNVGGETLDAALANISQGARVVLCGGTS